MAFIYSILPEYTHSLDTLEDYSYYGKTASLEGYTNAIDESVFNILRSSIREIISFQDVYKISEQYLPYFSFLLGYRWNDYIDADMQRNIVSNILQLYKRKGTIFSFHFNLYNVDQLVTIKEPYKDLFVLNRSKLSSDKHMPSQDYYSYGIIVIQMNAFITEIYEIIESIRPAGWKFLIENNRKIYTDMNYKPKDKDRVKGIPSSYKYTNNDDELQYQMNNSTQYSKEDVVIITPINQSITASSRLNLEYMLHNSLLKPKENLGYNTFLRYGQHFSEIHEIEYVKLKMSRTGILGLMYTRTNTENTNYSSLCSNVNDRLIRDYTDYEFNDLNVNAELVVNSLQYGRTNIDKAIINHDCPKQPVLMCNDYSFIKSSPEMQSSIKKLKMYTINSFEHILSAEIKDTNITEDRIEGYNLNRISMQHFTRRLIKI